MSDYARERARQGGCGANTTAVAISGHDDLRALVQARIGNARLGDRAAIDFDGRE
ncbi:hypothetical protein ACM0CO_19435 [Mycobacteroides abscessus subsp. abscessus]|uniref:hypothetical protein n=1 Tax=Mycobacteroides abscessus TaxID=36809 RepID=UPI0039F1358B